MIPKCAFPNCRCTATKNSPLCGACERNALRRLEQEMEDAAQPIEPWAGVRATLEARKQAQRRRYQWAWLTVAIVLSLPVWIGAFAFVVMLIWGGG